MSTGGGVATQCFGYLKNNFRYLKKHFLIFEAVFGIFEEMFCIFEDMMSMMIPACSVNVNYLAVLQPNILDI